MKNFEELLKETSYTSEEWKIFKKVEKNNQLQDLNYMLDLMLDNGDITKAEYKKALENAGWIIEKYNKWLDYDWSATMREAINYVIDD